MGGRGVGTKRCGSPREWAGIACSGIGHLFRPAGVDDVLEKIRRIEGDAFWCRQYFGDWSSSVEAIGAPVPHGTTMRGDQTAKLAKSVTGGAACIFAAAFTLPMVASEGLGALVLH
jgi:hypothetical protein